MEKLESKMITTEIKQINAKIKQHSINKLTKSLIEKNLVLLQVALQDLVKLKKIGSYAINGIYNNNKLPEIDLLALKYVNHQLYETYLDEISTKDHFSDCWICELNQTLLKTLKSATILQNNFKIEWKLTKFRVKNGAVFEFKDALELIYLQNGAPVFKFILRTALTHKDNLPVYCDKLRYQQTSAIEFVKTYHKLNQVLLKKVEILFLFLTKKYEKSFTRKELLMMKIFILSDLQTSLMHNKYMRYWLTKMFYKVFPNKKLIDDLFITNRIYYQNQKPIRRIYQAFQLKKLRWVYNHSFTSVHIFLNHYLNAAKNFVTQKKYTSGFVDFWYDSIVYLQSSNRASTYTKKQDYQKLRHSGVSIISKNIYPSDNNIGFFLVILSYYQFKINYFRKGK